MIAEMIQGCLSFAMSWVMMYCGLTWLANHSAILGKVTTKLTIVVMAVVCVLSAAWFMDTLTMFFIS